MGQKKMNTNDNYQSIIQISIRTLVKCIFGHPPWISSEQQQYYFFLLKTEHDIELANHKSN